MGLIDWARAVREETGYPSLGHSENLRLGRVAIINLPHADKPHVWVMGATPIGPRLSKRDKVRLGRSMLEATGRSDVNDKATDDDVASMVADRVQTSPNLHLSRYPSPAETHAGLKETVSYSHESGCGSRDVGEILLVP